MHIATVNYQREKDILLIQYPKDFYHKKEIDEISQSVQKIFPNNSLFILTSRFYIFSF